MPQPVVHFSLHIASPIATDVTSCNRVDSTNQNEVHTLFLQDESNIDGLHRGVKDYY